SLSRASGRGTRDGPGRTRPGRCRVRWTRRPRRLLQRHGLQIAGCRGVVNGWLTRGADVQSAPMSQLFQRKPIAQLVEETESAHGLKRSLGAGDLIMLAIGAVIGAGIFGAIGTAAGRPAGPSGGG